MKSNPLCLLPLLLLLLLLLVSGIANGQDASAEGEKLKNTILHYDSIFWQAYNTCDVEGMEALFTDDLEFYHDRAGLTTSSKTFFESVRSGLCGNPDWRLRREVVQGSLKVYPLNDYGAILSGEHVFYINEEGKKERLDGRARFTHVWRFKDDAWKMHRVLSYDHGPAPYCNKRKEISLSPVLLRQYSGAYESAKAGIMTVSPEGRVLRLEAGSFQPTLYPETENFFFLKERDLQFEFVREKNKVVKLVVHENGEVVEEARKVK